MYLGYQNNKIKFYVEKPLNPNFYVVDKWEETKDKYILCDDEYVLETSDKYKNFIKEERKVEILQELDDLDLKSIRAIRANDIEYIAKYEQQASELREELRNL